MQFSSAFLVTSFITFVSGVNCASFAFYENMALGCTDKDPAIYSLRTSDATSASILTAVAAPFRTVRGFDLAPEQRWDMHAGHRCTPSSVIANELGFS
ncbi:hypothetical protein BDQ17DRAFT_1439250 [Cyathus striatus]|nr:hypothetical protein BDQ17DRAFT_1439250 [Cyathus striatus]